MSNINSKKWRINTTGEGEEEILSFAPLGFNVLFSEEPIPDFTKIQELFLEGKRATDNQIRNMGIIISHDAVVFRRKKKEES